MRQQSNRVWLWVGTCSVLLLLGNAVAQETVQGAATVQNGQADQPAVATVSQQTGTMLSRLFAATNAELPPLATGTEIARANVFSGGLALGAAYDDNLLNTNPASGSGFTYLITPRMDLQITRPRTQWSLNYSPGVSRATIGNTQDFMTHDFSTELTRRMSKQWTVRARSQFLVSSNPFQIIGTGSATDTGVLDPRNDNIVTPFAKETTVLAGVDTTYQLGRSDYIGASGTWSSLTFKNQNEIAVDLINRAGASAQGFYAKQVTPRNLIGVEYRFQAMKFWPLHSATFTHSVLYFHAININPSWTVSFFAGPERADSSGEYADIPGIVPSKIDWNVSSGAVLAWQGRTDNVRASFARRITDGGGLASSMRQNSFGLDYRHLFSRRWAVTVGGRFDDGTALVSAGDHTIRTASGGIGFERTLTNSLSLQFGYERVQQRVASSEAGNKVDHNRGTVSIVYQFSRPLGR